MSNPYRPELPLPPPRIAALPVDHRGYPVPYFVAWVDGVPDHRVRDEPKVYAAIRDQRCWICGQTLGRYLTFVLGPMCAVNRVSSEPPAHRECALYSAQACPLLTRPHAHRREAGLPEEATPPPGLMIRRNPGVVLLWTTRAYRLERTGPGVLFRLVGEPTATQWLCEGRTATRAEVLASIDSGLPLLEEQARLQGAHAQRALTLMHAKALTLVPKEVAVHAQ